MLDSVPGTLMLTDCLEQCQANDSCSSINYETGLCVLFSSNADKLAGKISSFNNSFPICHKLFFTTSCFMMKTILSTNSQDA